MVPETHIHLRDLEIAILLGARLMYTGVPFHRVHKRGLSERETELLDGVRERLLLIRQGTEPSSQAARLSLSDAERRLYWEVLISCNEECGDDAYDMRIHLGTGERPQVEELLRRLAGEAIEPGSREDVE